MGWDGMGRDGRGGGAPPQALVDKRDAGGRDGLTSDVMFTERGRTKFHTWRFLWGHYEAKHTACVHARARRKH